MNKSKAKVLLISVIITCVLTSCAVRNEAVSEQYSLDCDDRFRATSNFAETEDAYITVSGDCLWYYDKQTGEAGVLCGKPACQHTDNTCGGYVGENTMSLSYYGGRLYWVSTQPDGHAGYTLFSSALDGTDRKIIKRIDYAKIVHPYCPYEYRIHRGMVFQIGIAPYIENGVPGKRLSVLSTKLSGDEDWTSVFEADYQGEILFFIRFSGDSLYLGVSVISGDTELEVIKLNCANVSVMQVYAAKGEELDDIYVDNDEQVYISTKTANERAVYKIADGSLNKLFSYEDMRYSSVYFAGSLAVASFRDNEGKTNLLINDMSGNVIYQGPAPQQYRGDMVVDPRGATREFCGGDESHFVINYGENMLQDLFTVVYKIEFGDITETLICHRENDVINHIQ